MPETGLPKGITRTGAGRGYVIEELRIDACDRVVGWRQADKDFVNQTVWRDHRQSANMAVDRIHHPPLPDNIPHLTDFTGLC